MTNTWTHVISSRVAFVSGYTKELCPAKIKSPSQKGRKKERGGKTCLVVQQERLVSFRLWQGVRALREPEAFQRQEERRKGKPNFVVPLAPPDDGMQKVRVHPLLWILDDIYHISYINVFAVCCVDSTSSVIWSLLGVACDDSELVLFGVKVEATMVNAAFANSGYPSTGKTQPKHKLLHAERWVVESVWPCFSAFAGAASRILDRSWQDWSGSQAVLLRFCYLSLSCLVDGRRSTLRARPALL